MIQIKASDGKVQVMGNMTDLNWSIIKGQEVFMAELTAEQIKQASFVLETYEQDQDEQWHEGRSEWKFKRSQ